MLLEPQLVLSRAASVFQSLGIPYLVGGSFASSLYGVPRSTLDIDIVADLAADHAEMLTAAFSREFHVDAAAVLDAIRERSSFNILHQESMFKVDVFVSPDDPWSRERLTRARPERLETAEGPITVHFSSPEDTLLHKLVWYRLGNERSDRQWNDALGLLKIQKGRLDEDYLKRWAPVLNVADLLERARSHSV